MIAEFRALTPRQRNAFLAAFLGWTLDAFDFFLLVFLLRTIAKDFQTNVAAVSTCITLTLAMRPVGALLFGWMADKYGRRHTLMINIACYSVLELLSAGAPNLTTLIVLRALFGIAMGGEWGTGTALAFETLPKEGRGLFSGILQQGYAFGNLIASFVFAVLSSYLGWRGMFVVGALPALLIIFIKYGVDESPVWLEKKNKPVDHSGVLPSLMKYAPRFLFLILLMTAFNFLSHGTQDFYPTFLEGERGLTARTVGTIGICYNIAAILGGTLFGALSERLGRRRAIVIAALCVLPIIPLWAYSTATLHLALGAVLMQFFVQGAWGVVPAHLNELAPAAVRGTMPGLAYQVGNLLASVNAKIQPTWAAHLGGHYSVPLAVTTAAGALVVALVAGFGREAKGSSMEASNEDAH